MLVELAVIVLLAAIVVFFSREFAEYIKKIFKITALALLLPIAIASWVLVYFNDSVLWFILTLRVKLNGIYAIMANWLAFPYGNYVAAVILLMILSVLPITLINVYYLRNSYREFPYSYIASAFVWILVLILLVV